MPSIPGNTGRTRIGDGWFEPAEPPQPQGARQNPSTKLTDDTYSVAILVGLNVGDRAAWRVDDVVKVVKKTRAAQVAKPAASFMTQLGLYTHDSGEMVSEDSVRVIVIKTGADESVEDFWRHMDELAEALCRKLDQESVLVERMRNGLSVGLFSVTP